MSLDELDKLVQDAGYAYQAKWSREREEYKCLGTNVTLDKNAGYGWLAEFERVVTDESEVGAAKAEIATLMAQLGVCLLQRTLARILWNRKDFQRRIGSYVLI
jgi:adenylate cyclase class IV